MPSAGGLIDEVSTCQAIQASTRGRLTAGARAARITAGAARVPTASAAPVSTTSLRAKAWLACVAAGLAPHAARRLPAHATRARDAAWHPAIARARGAATRRKTECRRHCRPIRPRPHDSRVSRSSRARNDSAEWLPHQSPPREAVPAGTAPRAWATARLDRHSGARTRAVTLDTARDYPVPIHRRCSLRTSRSWSVCCVARDAEHVVDERKPCVRATAPRTVCAQRARRLNVSSNVTSA